jgi:hypothetical protein
MRTRIAFTVVLSLVLTGICASQGPSTNVSISDVTGGKLLDLCKSDGLEYQFCEAFITGVRDGTAMGIALRSAKPIFNTPIDVTQKQLMAVVVKYLNDHPEEQHKPASKLVIYALAKAFPPVSAK